MYTPPRLLEISMKNCRVKVKVFLLLHLKLRYYEKATKLEKTAVLLSSVKISGRFFQNFVASEKLNFMIQSHAENWNKRLGALWNLCTS